MTSRSFRAVGLFAGVGGFEVGLARAGHTTHLLCEIDEPARAVLEAQFAGVALHGDVRSLDGLPAGTDLVVAGFPCQDLSQAGRTAGITGARSGLVSEVFRLLERARTPWVVLENVSFMLQLARGAALELVLGELERIGYRWAYRVVDSRAFGLPQRRERVYIAASLDGDPREVLFADEGGEPGSHPTADLTPSRPAFGFYWTEGTRGLGWARDAVPTLKGGSTVGVPSPPAIWLPDGRIVTPHLFDAERLQGFPERWTEPAETVTKRSFRWKLIGNAVSVPAAAWLGRRLAEPGRIDARIESTASPLGAGDRWPRSAWNVGSGRWGAEASRWPLRISAPALTAFLQFEPSPLSARATRGFLTRARLSSLRFADGFLDAVAAHLLAMEAAPVRSSAA